MFKLGSFENEIYRSMETGLIKNQTEDRHGFNKLAKAADLLNMAAAIFEKAGFNEEASEVTQILEDLSKDLND
ncbi:MAG TPA: hypothetical protein VII94_02680 [Candidatus Saccharimonadales bacterium]